MSDQNNRKDIYKNSIAIPLHGFKYFHHTHKNDKDKKKESPDQEKGFFFGREKEVKRFLGLLESPKTARGAYLITGYRGCGKTSFINEVLQRYVSNNKGKRIYIVRLNLSNNDSLHPFQIYKRMAKGLLDEVFEYRKTGWGFFKKIWVKYSFNITLISIVLFSFQYFFRIPLDLSSMAINSIILLSFFSLILYPLFFAFRIYYNKDNAYDALSKLITSIDNEKILKYNVGFKIPIVPFISDKSQASIDKKLIERKLETADIEYELNQILNNNIAVKSDVIFVFDELDKITSDKKEDGNVKGNLDKTEKLDELLGCLKNIMSENPARFIFIGGRDMHDSYLSQSGAVSSLYQSIFNESIYIPSLLSDDSDQQSFRINSMIEKLCVAFLLPEIPKKKRKKYDKKEIKYDDLKISNYSKIISDWSLKDRDFKEKEYIFNSIYVLRNFVHYLAFQSKGNYKIFLSVFGSFVYSKDAIVDPPDYEAPELVRKAGKKEGKEAGFYLFFKVKDIQKILLNSNLYISFHYHLSRRLRHADDKIIIASVSMMQFIIKFYNKGFSRRHLYNMYEVVNTNRPPELRGITEILIKNVLTSSLRKSRYCITRYRFTSLFENEVRYISETSADQSATYNFSLDALNYIKEKYISEIYSKDEKNDEQVAIYYLALGDFYYWEQSYDDAINSYLSGVELLRKSDAYLIYAQTYMELTLKLGLVFETRHNYSEALNVYHRAYKDSRKIYENNTKIKENAFPYQYGLLDAKLDYLAQPYWAWLMLNIKRSPSNIKSSDFYPDYIYGLYSENKEVLYYKTGIFFYYTNNFSEAMKYFNMVVYHLSFDSDKSVNDRDAFLIGRSLLFNSLCQIIDYSRNNQNDLVCQSNVGSLTLIANMKPYFKAKSLMDIEEEMTTDAEIVNEPIANLIKASLYFKEAGLHTNSIQTRLLVVIVWVFYLEVVPWRLASKNKNKEIYIKASEKIRKSGNLIEKYCIETYKESIRTHQKSFAEFINNHCNVDLEPWADLIDKDVFNIDPISMLSKMLEEKKREYYVPKVYWQRSIQGQYIFEIYLWQKRALQNLLGEKIMDLPINDFPQFGVRSFSITLTLSGRNKLNKLKKYINSENELNLDRIFTLSGEAVFYFYRAILYISQSSGNEQEMTFPPQSLVYYNLWEVLFEVIICLIEFRTVHFSSDDSCFNEMSFEKQYMDIEEEYFSCFFGFSKSKIFNNLKVLRKLQIKDDLLKKAIINNKDSRIIKRNKVKNNVLEKEISYEIGISNYERIKRYGFSLDIKKLCFSIFGIGKSYEAEGEKLLMSLINSVQHQIHSKTSLAENQDVGSDYDSEVPYSLCNLTRVTGLVKKHLSRTMKTLDPQSKAHQEVLFEKYYLNDDYDDPTFISDVFFYKAFAYPAKLHEKAVDDGMKELWAKWGLTYNI